MGSPFRVIPFGEVTAAITDTTDTKALRPLRKAGLAVVTPRS